MSDPDDSFAKLLGRQPSDAERQSLYRVRDALGLKTMMMRCGWCSWPCNTTKASMRSSRKR